MPDDIKILSQDDANHGKQEEPETLEDDTNQGKQEEPESLEFKAEVLFDEENFPVSVQYRYETRGNDSTLFVDIQEIDQQQDVVTLHYENMEQDDQEEVIHQVIICGNSNTGW
jgi:hypothetical protein